MLLSQLIHNVPAFWALLYLHVYLDTKEDQRQIKTAMVGFFSIFFAKNIYFSMLLKLVRDNCLINKCPLVASCLSSLGGFTCNCPSGYLYDNVI